MPGCEISGTGGAVIWFTDEDAAATLRRNLHVSGADLSKILIYRNDDGPCFVLPAGAELLEQTIENERCRLVVFDPIASFIDGSTNSEKAVRNAIRPLSAIAERTGASVALVRHLRKVGGSALYRGLGTVGLVAAARSALLVGAEPGANSDFRVVAQFKSSLAPLADSLAFRVMPEAGGARIEWVGISSCTAEQLLAGTDSGEATALMDACHVLYSLLGDGTLWVNDVKQLARRNGVADRTLRRAKDLLGVRSMRAGFGKGARYFWTLPAGSELIARLKAKDLDDLADALTHGQPEPPADPSQRGRSDQSPPKGFGRYRDDDDDDPADWWKG